MPISEIPPPPPFYPLPLKILLNIWPYETNNFYIKVRWLQTLHPTKLCPFELWSNVGTNIVMSKVICSSFYLGMYMSLGGIHVVGHLYVISIQTCPCK